MPDAAPLPERLDTASALAILVSRRLLLIPCAGLTLMLGIAMVNRFTKTKKVMPAGLVSVPLASCHSVLAAHALSFCTSHTQKPYIILLCLVAAGCWFVTVHGHGLPDHWAVKWRC